MSSRSLLLRKDSRMLRGTAGDVGEKDAWHHFTGSPDPGDLWSSASERPPGYFGKWLSCLNSISGREQPMGRGSTDIPPVLCVLKYESKRTIDEPHAGIGKTWRWSGCEVCEYIRLLSSAPRDTPRSPQFTSTSSTEVILYGRVLVESSQLSRI